MITTVYDTVKRLVIGNIPGLDPITVFIENYQPGQGRITVRCWGTAWTSYWGAMSDKSVEEFVASADIGYLVSNLTRSDRKPTKQETAWLTKIMTVVREQLS